MVLRLLLPIGFVGLVSIAVLLAIYLIRPQYKEKRISGTLVWKCVISNSKKQKLRLSNFLIFLVQAFVLTIIAICFAQPRLFFNDVMPLQSEYVIVVDASASMRAKIDDKTRFMRAIEQSKQQIQDIFANDENTTFSFIFADENPKYVFSDLTKNDQEQMFGLLDDLQCTLSQANHEKALNLASNRLNSNPYTKILFYTDTQFSSLGTAVEVVNVADISKENNVAILGCNVKVVDNEFTFDIVVGAYGDITTKTNISFDIKNADNGSGARDMHLDIPLFIATNETTKQQVQHITVKTTDTQYGGQEDWFFETYESCTISIENLNDSISDDDSYLVYGGIKDVIKIQYWSNKSNTFWQFGFNNLANNMSDFRNITFREVYHDQGMQAQNTGYDFYIFEHSIPTEILIQGLPKGVVIIADPDATINDCNIGITFNQVVSLESLTPCTSSETHQLIQYINPNKIHLTKYCDINVVDPDYKTLLYVNNNPALLVKSTSTSKIVVLPFSINMSDFYGDQFQIFLYNLINYFMPVTLNKYDFDLDEKTQFNCKGEFIEVEHNNNVQTFATFPSEYTFSDVGTYTFTTTFGLDKAKEVKRVYVHASTQESNIFPQSTLHANLENKTLESQEVGKDFFILLAIICLVLMVIEWYLQFKYIL